MRSITCLVIHHSASASGNIETIRQAHVAQNGWKDIGYHDIICNGRGAPDGHISKGRDHDKVGAGVFGANSGKLHVCLIGNFAKGDPGYSGPPTKKQLDSLGHWILTNCRRYKVIGTNVKGHKEVAVEGHGTLCPGFSEETLKQIRRWAMACLGSQSQCSLSDWLEEKIGMANL